MTNNAFDLKSYILKKVDNEIEAINKVMQFNDKELSEYKRLLEVFKTTNSSKASTGEKGKALEDIVAYVLEKSVVFEVTQNVRTSSNEIDLMVKLNDRGKFFKAQGYLNYHDKFISECKNYSKSISVTWVGKFFSLLSYTKNDLGIIFSYKGLSGTGWNNATGLTKKLFLAKEGIKIIDFNINDFDLLAKGASFIKIINDKIFTLENDTSFISYIEKHPNEELLDKE